MEFQEVCHFTMNRNEYAVWPLLYGYKICQHCECPACLKNRVEDKLERCESNNCPACQEKLHYDNHMRKLIQEIVEKFHQEDSEKVQEKHNDSFNLFNFEEI